MTLCCCSKSKSFTMSSVDDLTDCADNLKLSFPPSPSEDTPKDSSDPSPPPGDDEEADALPAMSPEPRRLPSQSSVDANPLSWSASASIARPVTISTSKDSPKYVMQGVKKLVVLNHKNFHPRLKLNTRRGTEIDVKAIESSFKPLGWDVDVLNDCTTSQIRDAILRIQISEEDICALAIFILSHGEDNGTVFAQDGLYRVDHDILYPLAADKCPILAGKPKMIFVQACQGQDTDSGTSVTTHRKRHTSSDNTATYKIPNYADFVIFQASFWQHYSFRSGDTGSWFIQALCSKVDESEANDAFFDILLDVSHSVALHKESNVPQKSHLDKKKQVPLLYSTMLRKLYLKEKPVSPEGDTPTVSAELEGCKDLKEDGESIKSGNGKKKASSKDCVVM